MENRPGPLSKKKRPLEQTISTDIIEVDDSDDDSSSHSNSNSRETRSRNRPPAKMRKIEELREEGGMSEFNPEKSQREKRKISKVVQATSGVPPVRKKGGFFTKTGGDTCDCLEPGCAGCFFPCHKCNTTKCALTCRRRRNWYYDKVTIDGQITSSVSMSINDLLSD